MTLTAADLQKRHQLEGAPDPFPSLVNDSPVKSKKRTTAAADIDTGSETAFPSLSPSSAPAPATNSAWGAAPRIRPVVSKAPTFSDSFTLTSIDLSSGGRDGKPTTLGEVIKSVQAKHKVKIDASTNQLSRQYTFHMKAESEKELEKAKRILIAHLSPMTKATVNAPASTIPIIIGNKGATLKQIREQTGVRVDIPPKDSITNGSGSGTATPTVGDEDEEPMVPITLEGATPLVEEARELINAIIATRISKSTQRVRDIPAHILPFVLAKKAEYEAVAEPETINLLLKAADREITVSGEREAVNRVVEAIKSTIEGLKSNLTSVKLTLPKRQHRLLTGKAVDQLLSKTKCAVIVPSPEDASEEVVVWGQGAELAAGLGAVMERANSQHIHEFPLPGPIALSKQLLTYMTRIQYPKTLGSAHPGVSVYTPHPSVVDKAAILNIDIVGDKSAVDGVVRQVSELIGKLIGGTREVNIDWLVHRIITGKHAKKIKQFHDAHNVSVYFPPELAEKSEVLLVYDPLSPTASLSPDEKAKHLDDVSEELLKIAKEAGNVKSQTLTVEKRWHEAVVGRGGTTLNAIIGEDKALSIKFGTEAGESATEDTILIRGASSDVDRAAKEILKIVDDAKNDEIVNSYSTEFEIPREFVGRVVGAQGSGINKLRDQLGVRVDVSDESEDKEKDGGKKKKSPNQKSKITITGRKENAEEAKKRILAQIERLADETEETLKIPAQYHSSLIGQSGKYAIRLEEKYNVKITFPRQSGENGEGKTREQLGPDEVRIKGGKKGVAGAKSELLEAVEFEKESNNVIRFTIPERAVPRVLGKGGATIIELKNETDAQIDIDKDENDKSIVHITVRGTKKAIAAAQTAIKAIADQVAEEKTITVPVEHKFHRTLIGPGGQSLKDLVIRCGGPTDPKLQAGLIRFPRQGEESLDEVRLRGEPKLVAKIQAELEKLVADLKSRVVLAVEVPSTQHRALIGRGGQHLNELQSRHGVQIQFPGSRSYNQVGEPENIGEFASVEAGNIVKVSGPRPACEKAIEDLKSQVKPAAPEAVTATASVPLKYHYAVLQQGAFLRGLRSYGVTVEMSEQPQQPSVPQPPNAGASEARIDDDEDTNAGATWEVTSNYQDAEEGTATWTLKARDQTGLDKAQKAVEDAVERAQRLSHVGFLTLTDRSSFPRIVGSKGANVARLRNETGADITVSKENNTIVIVGSENDIVAAKDAILSIATSRR